MKSSIKELVEHGADVNTIGSWPEDTYKWPLIFGPVDLDWPDCTAIMLKHGADPNAVEERGSTLLGAAVSTDDPKLIKLLLDFGSDRYRLNAGGETVMGYAREKGNKQIIALLTRYFSTR